MLALDNGAPKVLNMKQALSIFIKFQEEIVTRRTKYDLGKARDRVHIIQALQIVHDNIDEVVDIIKTSPNSDVAATRLTERFGFDDVQNKAVLDTTLKRLTGLETTKLSDERAQLEADILRYSGILNNFDTLKQVVLDELEETKNKFGDERRTEISNGIYSLEDEDLIADEEILIMLTESGYIKRITPDSFREQNRGGIGVIGMATKEDDVVQFMIHSRTKTDVLFFTNKGKVFRSRGYEIPEGTRTSKGIPAVNFIRLEDGEKILSIISAKEYDDKHFLFFTTEKGIVKRTVTKEFDNINSNGKIAIGLKDGDMLLDVKLTDGNALITLGASNGKACTFHESDVRAMGRTAAGVIGMNLDGAKVIDVCTNQGGKDILTLSEKGFGKRSPYSDFRLTSRGSKGVLALKMSDKTGALVALKAVEDDNDIVIITDAGTVMKTRVGDIHEAGRNTLGVKVITLRDKENISSVAIEPSEKDYEAQEAPAGDATNPEATEEDTEKLLYEQEKAHDVDDEDDDSSKGDNSKDDE
jgi:DNA gyrase subunit A